MHSSDHRAPSGSDASVYTEGLSDSRSARRRLLVHDMQPGYACTLTETPGASFRPSLEPQLTPARLLAIGIFGGRYTTDWANEFPSHWFTRARLCSDQHDPKLNYFGVNASQPLGALDCRPRQRQAPSRRAHDSRWN